VENLVNDYKSKGFLIEHIRRGTRKGYKAGALKHAMKTTDSELVAIFDADFIPPKWFLKKAVPYFSKARIGLIQCRWNEICIKYRDEFRVCCFHGMLECSCFVPFSGTTSYVFNQKAL